MLAVVVTLGLALIARNEETSLPRLLDSIKGSFDQVVLVDTGSKDKTVEVFGQWCQEECERNPQFSFKAAPFEWIDDFAAARNFAHSLLDTEWQVWADCDDVIVNAPNIRNLVAQAPPELTAYICDYNYAQDPNTGQCMCVLKRERIVRSGAARWDGRIHEAQAVQGTVTMVPQEQVVWVHQKPLDATERQYSNQRNLRILRKWLKEEPENTRVLAYVGTELAARGKHKQAIGYYKRYLDLNPDWHEEQAQVCRKMSASLIVLERYKEARDRAYRGMHLVPQWPDSYNTLAEFHFHIGEYEKTIWWADRVLEMGLPQTVLIINPLDYAYLPLKMKALAYIEMRDFDRALHFGKNAMALFPSDLGLQQAMAFAQQEAKREHTANTFVMACQQLIAHDEQLKAKTLIEDCVPHFATDHPSVVQIRSMLRERLLWLDGGYADHYEHGGSKPEDFHGDEMIDPIGNAISRTGLLAYELGEQYEQSQRETRTA